MKFSFAILLLSVAQATFASPVEERDNLWKRASASDVANIGFATQGGGTKGGVGGATVKVSTLADLTTALADDVAKIVIISGTITGDTVVKVGANKSVLGAAGASLVGVGLRVLEKNNVIIRNLKISKVLASAGDAIGIQQANNVWVDHVDVSSDMDHDKDYYDGLIDITHGCQYVTVSYSYIHDHWKSSLVGHSDNNGSEDVALKVTFAHNYWKNLNSRGPSFRFGTGHVFNNYYYAMADGINTRDAAQLLVQNNVWDASCKAPLYSTDAGFAVAQGNDFGGLANTALVGTMTTVPYSYSLTAVASVKSEVTANAGAILSF